MEKEATAQVVGEPGQSFFHFRPGLQVTGVPVVRQLELLNDVAHDCGTAKQNGQEQTSIACIYLSDKQNPLSLMQGSFLVKGLASLTSSLV